MKVLLLQDSAGSPAFASIPDGLSQFGQISTFTGGTTVSAGTTPCVGLNDNSNWLGPNSISSAWTGSSPRSRGCVARR